MDLCSKGLCREEFLELGATYTLAGLFRPVAGRQAKLYNLALVIGGSLLLGVASQVIIPLPIVPITGQTFALLLLGALLGTRLGVWAVLVYMMEGASGLPVFSEGRSGLAMLFGPTGGYLVGFLPAVAVVGFLAQRGWDRRMPTTFLAMVLGNVVLYGFGLGWLYLIGMDKVLAIGLYPFIVGDLIKALLAALILPLGWGFLNKERQGTVDLDVKKPIDNNREKTVYSTY